MMNCCFFTLTAVSMLTITDISVDRFLHVRFPLHYPRYATPRIARYVIALTWFLALLLGAVPVVQTSLHASQTRVTQDTRCYVYFMQYEYRAYPLLGQGSAFAVCSLVSILSYSYICCTALRHKRDIAKITPACQLGRFNEEPTIPVALAARQNPVFEESYPGNELQAHTGKPQHAGLSPTDRLAPDVAAHNPQEVDPEMSDVVQADGHIIGRSKADIEATKQHPKCEEATENPTIVVEMTPFSSEDIVSINSSSYEAGTVGAGKAKPGGQLVVVVVVDARVVSVRASAADRKDRDLSTLTSDGEDGAEGSGNALESGETKKRPQSQQGMRVGAPLPPRGHSSVAGWTESVNTAHGCTDHQSVNTVPGCTDHQSVNTVHGCADHQSVNTVHGCADHQSVNTVPGCADHQSVNTVPGCTDHQSMNTAHGCTDHQSVNTAHGCTDHQSVNIVHGCTNHQSVNTVHGCTNQQSVNTVPGCADHQSVNTVPGCTDHQSVNTVPGCTDHQQTDQRNPAGPGEKNRRTGQQDILDSSALSDSSNTTAPELHQDKAITHNRRIQGDSTTTPHELLTPEADADRTELSDGCVIGDGLPGVNIPLKQATPRDQPSTSYGRSLPALLSTNPIPKPTSRVARVSPHRQETSSSGKPPPHHHHHHHSHHHHHHHHHHAQAGQPSREIISVTLYFMVFGLFFILWSPTFLVLVFDVHAEGRMGWLRVLFPIGLLNTLCNVVVYAWKSPEMRDSLKTIWKGRHFCRQGPKHLSDRPPA